MNTQIRLFLTICSTSLVLIAVLIFGSRAYFLHNFSNYQVAQERQRLSQVAVILADYYAQESAPDTPSLLIWQRALRQVQRDLFNRSGALNFDDQLAFTALSLVTEQGEPVFGNAIDNPVTVPVLVGTKSVGLLSAPQPAIAVGPIDEVFRAQQGHAFIYAGLVAVVLAALSAAWISLWLRRKLTRLAAVSQALAEGNYEVEATDDSPHTKATRRDPVAALTQDMAVLAKALQTGRTQRQQLLSDIAHELRTPLTVLRGDLEAVQDGIRNADPQHQQRLYEQVLQLVRLTEDLHLLAQSDHGKLHYTMQPTDVVELTSRIVNRVRYRYEAAGLNLHFNCTGQAQPVYCDYVRIEQALVNLFENSLRYTSAPGQVACTLAFHSQQICWQFDDTAPSVSAADCSQLGERLYRPDLSRNRAQGGSGLGLAIVRSILQAHGGRVEFSPSTLGGLCVRLCIPLPTPTPTPTKKAAL
ncbi:ATP-binding protein [Aliidiomarina celeris]|uniref:ATP-binding protein n=1 Tax=Aliidiomarina celeris TaxID=2249428 RepID=UPI000DE82777|nr:ATP-binding protein [Aliidiomarina celeris]